MSEIIDINGITIREKHLIKTKGQYTQFEIFEISRYSDGKLGLKDGEMYIDEIKQEDIEIIGCSIDLLEKQDLLEKTIQILKDIVEEKKEIKIPYNIIINSIEPLYNERIIEPVIYLLEHLDSFKD